MQSAQAIFRRDASLFCVPRLGSEGTEFRYSDGGEPSGTAGTKILAAIQSKGLSDILVVVTRYFGGTKLGTGGLGRAYFDSASRALSEAVVVLKVVAEELQITFSYDETSRVMNTLSHRKAKIIDTVYDEDVWPIFSSSVICVSKVSTFVSTSALSGAAAARAARRSAAARTAKGRGMIKGLRKGPGRVYKTPPEELTVRGRTSRTNPIPARSPRPSSRGRSRDSS